MKPLSNLIPKYFLQSVLIRETYDLDQIFSSSECRVLATELGNLFDKN